MTHQHAADTKAIERYLLDEMPEIERYQFEAHYFECEECADALRLVQRLREEAKGVRPAPVSVSRTASPSRRTGAIALPWAAAAVLAVGLIYQMRAPQSSGSQAGLFAPVALRPATRGAVASVQLQAGGDPAVFALEVNIGTPGDRLEYRLIRDDHGTTVATGAAEVPTPGTPLILLVPRDRVETDGGYVLTLGLVGGSRVPPAEYRFNVRSR